MIGMYKRNNIWWAIWPGARVQVQQSDADLWYALDGPFLTGSWGELMWRTTAPA